MKRWIAAIIAAMMLFSIGILPYILRECWLLVVSNL